MRCPIPPSGASIAHGLPDRSARYRKDPIGARVGLCMTSGAGTDQSFIGVRHVIVELAVTPSTTSCAAARILDANLHIGGFTRYEGLRRRKHGIVARRRFVTPRRPDDHRAIGERADALAIGAHRDGVSKGGPDIIVLPRLVRNADELPVAASGGKARHKPARHRLPTAQFRPPRRHPARRMRRQECSTRYGSCAHPAGIEDCLGKCHRRFPRQVVTDATRDQPVLIGSCKLRAVGSRIGMRRTIGIALHGDGKDCDERPALEKATSCFIATSVDE